MTKSDFDHDDDVTLMEEEVLVLLEEAQSLYDKLSATKVALATKIIDAAKLLLPITSIIDRRDWSFNLAGGNARGSHRFEVASDPRSVNLSLMHPSLSTFLIDAWPLNVAGQRMSGRAGNTKSYARGRNTDTVVLSVYVNDARGIADERSSNDIFIEMIRRAALTLKEPT